ncbi:putative 2-aminoethylphosphonate ABC transporter ATP-binding protein [Stella sp.]|uniref:putative 2-aminoethylphosphonate ABC transporter ATP-binding protein n=1 Tax=Stella sp. TaxID=2912054 RepID=UPI0035B1300C
MNADEGARPNGSDGRPPYLTVAGLEKRFGAFTALSNIDLAIREGEFVCFLGPSGCGKTTLLRAIAGLDRQSRGTIVQAGRDISALPPAQRDYGIVFQSYALFPNLTVAENIGYGLVNRRLDRRAIAARVEELLGLIGLSGSGPKYPAQLSGGQQQRVALARALATRPGLLLLDEPLSALDARVRLRLRGEIRDLQRRLGVTTIMVTHDQEEAISVADRIVVMNHGRIEQVDTPERIYRAPATLFVAGFVGTMNFLTGARSAPGRVRVGGFDLQVAGAGPVSADPCTACVRPEDFVIRNVAGDTPNAFTATIEAMEFLGAVVRARLQAPRLAGAPLLADFSLNAVTDLGLGPGQSVTVALPPERVRVFAGVPE